MRYYFIIRILTCSFLTFSQIYSTEIQNVTDNEELKDLDPKASLDETLKQLQRLLQKINAPLDQESEDSDTNKVEISSEESSAGGDANELQQESMLSATNITVSICRQIIKPKLRNLVGTLAMYGPHALSMASKPVNELVRGLKGLMSKDQAKLNPLEYALKHNLCLLSNILTILDTANTAQRNEIASNLNKLAPLLGSIALISEKKAMRAFYDEHCVDDLKDEAKQTAFSDSLKELVEKNNEEGALRLFKSNLKPGYSDKQPQELFDTWKANIASQGKVERILKSLAFIVKHPDITRKAFKGHSPIEFYFFKKNTPEMRKAALTEAINTYNEKVLPEEQIILDDIFGSGGIWKEFDNFYKIISIGKFAIKARNFAFSAVNLFRRATFRKARDFENLEYKDATETVEEINKSWIKTFITTGKIAIQIGEALQKGARAIGWLVFTVDDSIKNGKVGFAIKTAKELTSAGIEMISNSFEKAQAFVQPVQETIRSCWESLRSRAKALFTRNKDSLENEQEESLESGQDSDMAKTIRIATEEAQRTGSSDEETEGIASALTSYFMSAASGAGAATVSAATTLVARLTATAFKSSQTDGTFSRDETTKIIVESLVRQLMEGIEAREKKEGLITDKEKQQKYEEQLEALIKKEVTATLEDIRAQINSEKGRVRALVSYFTTTAVKQNDDYLRRFNTALELKIPSITNTLTLKFNEIEGTTERDATFLSELVKSRIKDIYKKALTEYQKKGEEIIDDQEYAIELQQIIEEATQDITQQMSVEMLTQKERLTDAQYSERFQALLEEKITASEESLRGQFDALESKHERIGFHDAIEAEPVRILPENPTIEKSDVTTYEKLAYDRLFAIPGASDTPSSFQKAIQGCIPAGEESSPLATLIGFSIESTLLQSDSYRAEVQSTGIKSFLQGLDSGNNVTRLVDGASNLSILKLAAKTATKDLAAVIKAARIVGTLAHDSLIEDFFNTHCSLPGNRPLNDQQKKDIRAMIANPKKTDQQKRDFLEPYLKPDAQKDSALLCTTLQHHLELPARLEISLFFLEYQKAITDCFKKSKRPDYAQDIFEKIGSTVSLEKIRAMLPALQEYHKAITFFDGRRIQFVRSLSYKIKNFFQLMTKGVKVINYKRNVFKALNYLKEGIERAWVKALKESSLPETITQPQQTATETLLEFISQNQPEQNPVVTYSRADDEQNVMTEVTKMTADIARETKLTDVIHLFLQGLTGLESEGTDTSYQDAYSTISDYINGTSAKIVLPLGGLLRATAPSKLRDPNLAKRALCGIVLLDALRRGNLTTNLDRDNFSQLTDQLYNRVTKGKKTLTLEDFNNLLRQIPSDEVSRMITSVMNDNIDTANSEDTDPLSSLGLRTRSGSTVSTRSTDSFHSAAGDINEQPNKTQTRTNDLTAEREKLKEEQEERERNHRQTLEKDHARENHKSPVAEITEEHA